MQDGEADTVTTAQAKLDDLGQLFYSSIGEVWQQAVPVPVGVGLQPVASGRESASTNTALAHEWAAKLGNAARDLQSAVDQLDSASRASTERDTDDCQTLREEEERGIAEGEQLLVSIASAEQWLLELQRTIRRVNSRAVAAKTTRATDESSEGAD